MEVIAMIKEDYFKYYIQGSDHYLIPKDVFDELFDEMENWKQDTQKYKEVIDKLKTNIENDIDGFRTINEFGESNEILELLDIYSDILKEVE